MPRGGARDGAGGPRGPRKKLASSLYEGARTPLEYMLGVMNDLGATQARRDRMAIAAAGYVHPKQGEDGKKDQRGKAAREASRGRFAPAAPPKLAIVPPPQK